MRKLMSLLLCGALCISVLAGCSKTPSPSEDAGKETGTVQSSEPGTESTAPVEEESGEKTYDKKIAFTATTYYSEESAALGLDYKTEAELYPYIMEKFNIEMDVWSCPSAEAAEKQRTWINGGTMPDMMRWSVLDLSEYLAYVDQGLLKPLPEGWAEKWPNLKKVVDASGLEDAYTVDGELYLIPTATFCNFLEVGDALSAHSSVFYRKDWAKQVGMEDFGADGTISLEEIKTYLQKVDEAGLGEVLLGSTGSYLIDFFARGLGINIAEFQETDNGFIYAPAQEDYKKVIATMQEWYNDGLIDPDFYVQTDPNYYREMFSSDLLAMFPFGGSIGTINNIIKPLSEAGIVPEDTVGFAQIRGEDGVVYSSGTVNYWGGTLFNPDTDDETQERILDMMEYFATEEGEVSRYQGIRGLDWDYDENGGITILRDIKELEISPNKGGLFTCVSIAGDDYQMSGFNTSNLPQSVDWAKGGYEIRDAGTIWPFSVNYLFYIGEEKQNYSVPLSDKVLEIVCKNEDIDSTWQSFLTEYEAIWKPLLDVLNATYYPGK